MKRLLSTDAEAVSVRILLREKKSSNWERVSMHDLGVVERRGELSCTWGCEKLGDKHVRDTKVLELYLCLLQSLLFLHGDLPCRLCYCTEQECK